MRARADSDREIADSLAEARGGKLREESDLARMEREVRSLTTAEKLMAPYWGSGVKSADTQNPKDATFKSHKMLFEDKPVGISTVKNAAPPANKPTQRMVLCPCCAEPSPSLICPICRWDDSDGDEIAINGKTLRQAKKDWLDKPAAAYKPVPTAPKRPLFLRCNDHCRECEPNCPGWEIRYPGKPVPKSCGRCHVCAKSKCPIYMNGGGDEFPRGGAEH